MSLADDVIATARAQIGKPYQWGATGPDAFDCSGLIWFSFHEHGIEVGRDTAEQQRIGSPVPPGQEQPGDCPYFGELSGPSAHGGIFEGNDRMVDAPHTGAFVREDSVKAWSASGEALRGFVRFLPAASPPSPGDNAELEVMD